MHHGPAIEPFPREGNLDAEQRSSRSEASGVGIWWLSALLVTVDARL